MESFFIGSPAQKSRVAIGGIGEEKIGGISKIWNFGYKRSNSIRVNFIYLDFDYVKRYKCRMKLIFKIQNNVRLFLLNDN